MGLGPPRTQQTQPSLARRSPQSTSRASARGSKKGEGFAECEFVGQSGVQDSGSGTGSPCGPGAEPPKRQVREPAPARPTVTAALGAGAGRRHRGEARRLALRPPGVLGRKGRASSSSCCLSKRIGSRMKGCGLGVEQRPLQTANSGPTPYLRRVAAIPLPPPAGRTGERFEGRRLRIK